MCRVYGVTRPGFYAWLKRPPSESAEANEALLARIKSIHQDSQGTYGSPRITAALKADGETVGKNRVARIMRENQVKARSATLYRSNPGQHAFFTAIPNQSLEAVATEPNRVWVGDVTYLKVGEFWRYLAVVMDKCSRRIVGWSLGAKRDAQLTLRALNHAVQNRKPSPGLVFHSDRGVEYNALAYRNRLARLGVVQSMNRPHKKMTDNAHMESFFHSMKSDVIHGREFHHEKVLRKVVKEYMPFYNHKRLHTSLNAMSPAQFEAVLA